MYFLFTFYFNVGEFGRFVLDQFEVAATPKNLVIVNDALRSTELNAHRYFCSAEGQARVDRVSQDAGDSHCRVAGSHSAPYHVT